MMSVPGCGYGSRLRSGSQSRLVQLSSEIPIGRAAVYYVDVKNPGCSDAPGFGSEAKPYCSLSHVSTIAVPGDTFLFKSGRYGNGPASFKRTGTATAPITYRAIGDVVIGRFVDVRDEDFKPTTLPNVYSLAWTNPAGPARPHQTFYDPILVDDPSSSIFTMRQEDGPLGLSPAPDDAALVAHEGTYRWDSASKLLRVHPYSNRAPSASGTDLVVALSGNSINVEAGVQYNVFDGFRIAYGNASNFQVNGSNNRFLNLSFQGVPWGLRGTNNYAQKITVTHVINRGPEWLWYDSGSGTALVVTGTGHRLENIEVFHSWNASVGAENAPGLVIDGLRAHGAPNHCSSLTSTNLTIRNAVYYNCQEALYLAQSNNVLFENVTVAGGILLQGITAPMGKVTIRNSIFQGSFVFTGASKPEHCQWESVSVLENSVVATNAVIERCASGAQVPIQTYMARCASGELTGCMTIRNIRLVNPTEWKTVMKDGMWNAALGDRWDVSLVPGSPAIDGGTVSGTSEGYLGSVAS